jgi:hypothetical protein
MGISAIYGLPGKGKSLFSTFYGFYLAEKYEKQLVSNFFFQPEKVAQYYKLMNYQWLLNNLDKGIIHYISCEDSLSEILSIKDSIILLDEAAIYLPARGSTHNTPKQLMKDLCQVRHDSQYLIYICQNEKQVDSFLRNLTEEIFHCNGISVWDKKLRNQKLVYKITHLFTVDKYEQWLADPKLRKNPIKTRALATKSWTGVLTTADMFLFSLYDSFNRLENQTLELNQGELGYVKRDDTKFPVIAGKHNYRCHRFSWFIALLFTKMPDNFLPRILNWDKQLARIPSRFNPYEKFIIRAGGVLLFLAVAGLFV